MATGGKLRRALAAFFMPDEAWRLAIAGATGFVFGASWVYAEDHEWLNIAAIAAGLGVVLIVLGALAKWAESNPPETMP